MHQQIVLEWTIADYSPNHVYSALNSISSLCVFTWLALSSTFFTTSHLSILNERASVCLISRMPWPRSTRCIRRTHSVNYIHEWNIQYTTGQLIWLWICCLLLFHIIDHNVWYTSLAVKGWVWLQQDNFSLIKSDLDVTREMSQQLKGSAINLRNQEDK